MRPDKNEIINALDPVFRRIDGIAAKNTERVLCAFKDNRVSDSHFGVSTGYGYNDAGRDTLDAVFAQVFGAPDAIMRINFVSGTHAITCALFAALKPGKTLLAAAGAPYDTLHGVIGLRGDYPGSLKAYGIGYAQAELTPEGLPDPGEVRRLAGNPGTGAVLIQRSRGYSSRKALSCAMIAELCRAAKQANPDVCVVVDNCYGEFVEETEPGIDKTAGADLLAGSLIKNPGGGLAPTGGYVAGLPELVEAAAMRLTAPGIGRHCGANLGQNRALYQGLFLAPHTTAQALKTAVFAAELLSRYGISAAPGAFDARYDIVQSIEFGAKEPLLAFCRGIQAGSPVDSFACPEPSDMPGYGCEVIMASGSFVQGASIELGCDAPVRPPYTAFLQGGLTFEAGCAGVLRAVNQLVSDGLL